MPTARQPRHRRLSQLETEHDRRVLEVATVVSATLGGDFFRSLVEHLSRALTVDCIYVAELIDGPRRKLRTVAARRDRALVENFDQELSGTASLQVLMDGAVSLSADSARIFPLDTLLQGMGAEGYVGIRLCDFTGQAMGLLAAASMERLRDLPLVISVLQTFALRAAAELERKRLQDALKESEERYKAFISVSRDAMWRIDFERPVPLDIPEEDQVQRIIRDGYLAEYNDATTRLAGLNAGDDLTEARIEQLFSAPRDRICEELLSFVRSGCRSFTAQTSSVNARGKKLYQLRTHRGIVENNQLLRIWGTTRDITDIRRAENAAEASERLLHQVLDRLELPAMLLDARGEITFCNVRLGRLTASSRAQLTGRNWLDLTDATSERDAWAAVLSGQAESHGNEHIESVIHLRDGSSRRIVWDTTVLYDQDGDADGVAAIGRQSEPASA